MASAEEGGATANGNSSSSYGGGGAGGKFRKKPFRRQSTPYDRPPAGLRGNTHKPESWLSKLFVDPAYKLISYGADRFFASVFRKRLPAPPSPQPPPRQPDVKHIMNDASQAAAVNDKEDTVDPVGAEGSLLSNGLSSNGISELEQLMNQKKFTRSEILHLTELLKSKEADVSSGNSLNERDVTTSIYGKHQVFSSSLVGENRNEGRLPASLSTPLRHLKVPAQDLASPAELAKTYTGSRGSNASPSVFGVQSNYSREDSGFCNNGPFAAKSPLMSSANKSSVSSAVIKNDFATPRSRGRSAIYKMAQTPYSRSHSSLKGFQFNGNGTGAAFSSSPSLYLKENDEIYGSKNLKRRSSVLEDEVGFAGPVRRIRKKSNLLAPRIFQIPLGVNYAKQKPELMGEPSNKTSKSVGENENKDSPSTSYAHVSSKSSEMAAKILQQLEKLSPKEKQSESKSALGLEKSQLRLTTNMLSGQALRSMEALDSPKSLLDFEDEKKLLDMPIKSLPDAYDHLQKPGTKAENGPRDSFSPSGTQNDSLLLKPLVSSTKNARPGIGNGASEPSHTKRAFKMSAKEESFELDDDIPSTSHAFRNFSETPGVAEPSLTLYKVPPSKEFKNNSLENQPGFVPPLVLTSSKEHEIEVLSSSEVREKSSVTLPASNEPHAIAAQSSGLPPVGKPEEANDKTSVLSSTSKVNNTSSLSSKFAKEAASGNGSSFSLINSSQLSASRVENTELQESVHLRSTKAGNDNGKSDSVPLSVNGPSLFSAPSSSDVAGKPTSSGLLFSGSTVDANIITSSSSSLFTAASFSDVAEKPTGSGLLFSNSTGAASNITSSTSAPFGGSIFGLDSKTSSSAGLFATSTAPTIKSPEVSGYSAKAEMQKSSGSSIASFSFPADEASSSGNTSVGLGSNFSQTVVSNLKGFLFDDSGKSLLSANGTSAVPLFSPSPSPSPSPSFNVNGSSSPGFSSASQALGTSSIFPSSASASSSDTTKILPQQAQSSNVANTDANAATAEITAATSGSGTAGSAVNFGLGSSSSSTSTISGSGTAGSAVNFGLGPSASSTSAADSGAMSSTPAFNFASTTGALGSGIANNLPFSGFAAGSSGSAAINTASSFSNGNSGVSVFGGSSIPATSTVNPVSSSSASLNVFGSSWQTSKFPAFGTTFTSFGASSSVAPVNSAPLIFNSSAGASPFTAVSSSAASSPFSASQPIFEKPLASGFTASLGNNDQMHSEDSMAEDPVQSSAPTFAVFGQSSAPQSAPSFGFGLTVPSQASPFIFSGHQNQVAPLSSAPFQSSGSLEFNAGGGFSMGSGAGDKNRRVVRVSKSKNRKK